MQSDDFSPLPKPRIAAIDVLRGAALAAMFSYHFVWDLGFLGFIPAEIPTLPGFMDYGHAIASTFLLLVGVSLVLASNGAFAWRSFTKRLAKIVAAAAAVTLATFYFFPNEFIFFGILQCIAVASVAAVPFLRAPLWLSTAIAGTALALPFFAANGFFNAPQWQWLGLGTVPPQTLDWRPFLPWFGVVLVGVIVARAALARRLPSRVTAWRARRRVSRGLEWGGRHSLLLYLVHQPVFLALLYSLALVAGIHPQPEDAPFLRNCQSRCVATGALSSFCTRTCGCIVARAQRSDLWQRMLRPGPDPEAEQRFRAVTRECARAERPKNEL